MGPLINEREDAGLSDQSMKEPLVGDTYCTTQCLLVVKSYLAA